MSSIFILIFLGFFVAAGFLAACIWAIHSGQFEDVHTPAIRILFENKIKEDELTDVNYD